MRFPIDPLIELIRAIVICMLVGCIIIGVVHLIERF